MTDYTGAGSRLTPERGLALDPAAWAWQPKVDGVYARVSTDRRGRIFSVLSRAGQPIAAARSLLGLLAGPPDSVLHGELEAGTEAGRRAAALRGWAALHLFDCTRHGGRDVSGRPALERHGLLGADRAELVAAGTSNPWVVDDQGDAHDVRTGRYTRPVPRDHRRLPIVPLVRDARELWGSFVVRGGGEGVVAVKLDGAAGRRGSKRKVKASDTLDCTVVAIGGGVAELAYGGRLFLASARGRWSALPVGARVEVQADGWYEAGATPRFARIQRLRTDLPA